MNDSIRESVELRNGAAERRADAALRWNEERYRTLFDLGPVAVYSCDASLRILIVDDNRDAADVLAILLHFSGHETHMAHDGVEAVEARRYFNRT